MSSETDEEDTHPLVEALEAHVRQNRDRLVAQLVGWGVAPDRGEDLLHDSVVRAIAALPQLEERAKLKGWFHRILRNMALDHQRAQKREGLRNSKWSLQATRFTVPEFQPNLCQCVHEVIPTLKPEYAEAIRDVEMSDEEMRDVAARIGISYNNLKVRVYRARRKLRERLEETCRKCAEQGCLDCTCSTSASSSPS